MPRSHRVKFIVPGAIALEVLQFPSPPHPPGPPIFLAGGPGSGPVGGNEITVRTRKFVPFPPFRADQPSSLVVHAWFPPGPASTWAFNAPPPVLMKAFPVMVSKNKTIRLKEGSDWRSAGRRKEAAQAARRRRAARKGAGKGRRAQYQGAYGQDTGAALAGARAATNRIFGPGSTYSYGAVSAASAAPVGSVAEVPPNTLTQVSDTIFCKRYPLTCANMQALGHGAYGSQTMDPNLPEFDDTSNGAEDDGWFQDEVVEKPMRTAGVLALAGFGIWLLSGRGY